LANDTIDRITAAAKLKAPWFLVSGFARPHAPWRVPQRFWDMYKTEDIPLAKHRTTIENMPGMAWHQQGFWNSSSGESFVPKLDQPIPDAVQREMRHAYYASVTWVDHQIGRIVDHLKSLSLYDETIILLHGDHGWQLGEHNDWHKQTNFELATRASRSPCPHALGILAPCPRRRAADHSRPRQARVDR